MIIDVLSDNERVASGFTHRLTLTWQDLKVETSGAAFPIFPKLSESDTFKAGTMIQRAAARVTEEFVAASLTALTLAVGDGSDADRYLTTAVDGVIENWYPGAASTMVHLYSAADTIDLTATATGAALSALTAGEVEIYLAVADLNKISAG